MRRFSHRSKQPADERHPDEALQRFAQFHREIHEFHALLVRAHLAAGNAIVRLGYGFRQFAVNQQFAADAQVDLEGACVEFDGGCCGIKGVGRQAPDDDGCGALNFPVALADAHAREVADNEIDRLRITFGFQQIAEEGQHVVELPAGEAVVGFVQALIVEVFGVQFIAARDGAAEFLCSLLSVGS